MAKSVDVTLQDFVWVKQGHKGNECGARLQRCVAVAARDDKNEIRDIPNTQSTSTSTLSTWRPLIVQGRDFFTNEMVDCYRVQWLVSKKWETVPIRDCRPMYEMHEHEEDCRQARRRRHSSAVTTAAATTTTAAVENLPPLPPRQSQRQKLKRQKLNDTMVVKGAAAIAKETIAQEALLRVEPNNRGVPANEAKAAAAAAAAAAVAAVAPFPPATLESAIGPQPMLKDEDAETGEFISTVFDLSEHQVGNDGLLYLDSDDDDDSATLSSIPLLPFIATGIADVDVDTATSTSACDSERPSDSFDTFTDIADIADTTTTMTRTTTHANEQDAETTATQSTMDRHDQTSDHDELQDFVWVRLGAKGVEHAARIRQRVLNDQEQPSNCRPQRVNYYRVQWLSTQTWATVPVQDCRPMYACTRTSRSWSNTTRGDDSLAVSNSSNDLGPNCKPAAQKVVPHGAVRQSQRQVEKRAAAALPSPPFALDHSLGFESNDEPTSDYDEPSNDDPVTSTTTTSCRVTTLARQEAASHCHAVSTAIMTHRNQRQHDATKRTARRRRIKQLSAAQRKSLDYRLRLAFKPLRSQSTFFLTRLKPMVPLAPDFSLTTMICNAQEQQQKREAVAKRAAEVAPTGIPPSGRKTATVRRDIAYFDCHRLSKAADTNDAKDPTMRIAKTAFCLSKRQPRLALAQSQSVAAPFNSEDDDMPLSVAAIKAAIAVAKTADEAEGADGKVSAKEAENGNNSRGSADTATAASSTERHTPCSPCESTMEDDTAPTNATAPLSMSLAAASLSKPITPVAALIASSAGGTTASRFRSKLFATMPGSSSPPVSPQRALYRRPRRYRRTCPFWYKDSSDCDCHLIGATIGGASRFYNRYDHLTDTVQLVFRPSGNSSSRPDTYSSSYRTDAQCWALFSSREKTVSNEP